MAKMTGPAKKYPGEGKDDIHQHTRMAMGQKITGMKTGGAVKPKSGKAEPAKGVAGKPMGRARGGRGC